MLEIERGLNRFDFTLRLHRVDAQPDQYRTSVGRTAARNQPARALGNVAADEQDRDEDEEDDINDRDTQN